MTTENGPKQEATEIFTKPVEPKLEAAKKTEVFTVPVVLEQKPKEVAEVKQAATPLNPN